MSRGRGRLERAVYLDLARHQAAVAAAKITGPWCVSSWQLAIECYRPSETLWGWTPTRVQQAMVVRAMHTVAKRDPRFGLLGGEGRRRLWLHDTTDPRSRAWLLLRFRKRRFLSWIEAKRLIEAESMVPS